ncbi:MAG: TIGR03067 domain-containing protein [Hyphomicrobium sp.]
MTRLSKGAGSPKTGLEGTWFARSATLAGKDAPKIVGQRLSFNGDRFRITKEGKLLFGGNFSVDATAEPPSIQFEQSETQTLSGSWLGIYELDGNTLRICDNAPDMTKPRPKNFSECAAAGYVLIRFSR